jgi:hypothetical protein
MKVQIVTQYRVSHLQRYGVTLSGNVTADYPPLYTRRNQCILQCMYWVDLKRHFSDAAQNPISFFRR